MFELWCERGIRNSRTCFNLPNMFRRYTVPLKDKRTKKRVANKSQTSLRFILTRLRLRLTKTQTKANALSMLINLRKHSHTQ